MSFLLINEPFSLLMIIPIMISIHITSITYVRLIGIFSIFLFTFGNIYMSKNEYIELWLVSIYLVFYLVFKAKSFFSTRKERQEERTFSDDNYIYNRDFVNDFSFDEFKNVLMKNCTVRRNKKNKKLFTAEGGPFDKIYYFVVVPNKALLTLKHQKMVISYIKEGSWIGVVEFVTQLFEDTHRKWQIGLEVENPTEEEIVWLEWDKDCFHKIFKKYKSTAFLKRLLTNWVKYLSLSTYKMDDHVATALGVITLKNIEQYPEALPYYRHISVINATDEEHEYREKDEDKSPLLKNKAELADF